MNKVIICIPVYKDTLDIFERVSLHQVKHILGEYPITFIAPYSLHFDYGVEYSSFAIERFEDKYFQNTVTYSALMLSVKFYTRFTKYQYVLIYQLDAFVFSDQLEAFCNLGYDYIGAPLPRGTNYWKEIQARVGNGGFSLRRVNAAINVLNKSNNLVITETMRKYEDLFFAYCGVCTNIDFKVPNVTIAGRFSLEQEVGHCYRNLARNLPFGCHAWYKVAYSVWKPFVESFGYVLPAKNLDVNCFCSERLVRINKYLVQRLLRPRQQTKLSILLNSILPDEVYAIWGGGIYGKICIQLLQLAQKRIKCIYDKNLSKNQQYKKTNFLLCYPDVYSLRQENTKIIVSSLKYEKEIKVQLLEYGLLPGQDFLLLSEVIENLTKGYLRAFCLV